MTDRPPLVAAHPIQRDGAWALRVECPYCGTMHIHGGGEGSEPDLPGHRVQHCGKKAAGRLPGYELTYADAAVNWTAERLYAQDLMDGIRAQRRSEEEQEHERELARIREINEELRKFRTSDRAHKKAERLSAAAHAFVD